MRQSTWSRRRQGSSRAVSGLNLDHHLERELGAKLGEAAFAAETPADLLRLIEGGVSTAPGAS